MSRPSASPNTSTGGRMAPIDYVSDYEEVTGKQRETFVEAKVIGAAVDSPAVEVSAVAETKDA